MESLLTLNDIEKDFLALFKHFYMFKKITHLLTIVALFMPVDERFYCQRIKAMDSIIFKIILIGL